MSLVLFDLEERAILGTQELQVDYVHVGLGLDERTVVVSTQEGIKLIDLISHRETLIKEGPLAVSEDSDEPTWAADYSWMADGRITYRLNVARTGQYGYTSEMRILDPRSGREEQPFVIPGEHLEKPVYMPYWSQDGRRAAYISGVGISLYEPDSGSITQVVQLDYLDYAVPWRISWHPSGRYLSFVKPLGHFRTGPCFIVDIERRRTISTMAFDAADCSWLPLDTRD